MTNKGFEKQFNASIRIVFQIIPKYVLNILGFFLYIINYKFILYLISLHPIYTW
jgi:hypothetical protein